MVYPLYKKEVSELCCMYRIYKWASPFKELREISVLHILFTEVSKNGAGRHKRELLFYPWILMPVSAMGGNKLIEVEGSPNDGTLLSISYLFKVFQVVILSTL